MDVFTGIGGFSLAGEWTGRIRPVRFCEIDPFCRQVLAKQWPGIPCDEDIERAEFEEGEADIIAGGFPCQDVSLAGNRAGLAGKRSGLYRELVRAIRVVRPLYALLENVAALLSDGMGTVLGDLAEIGADAEWDCVPAITVGAPHERDRVWTVVHPRGIAAYPTGQQVGSAGQSRLDGSVVAGDPDPTSDECGQGRPRRPPDSFARVREQTRRYVADPHDTRCAFGEGVRRDARPQFEAAQRDGFEDERQSIWPDEPALSGVDDVVPDWMDRTKATGNAILPKVATLIFEGMIAGSDLQIGD